ncbi:hypothetical protein J7S67_16165 [Acinetobacter baumannii]|nr:hypothetical protein [Acinetobacter baumannii]
MLKTIVEFKFDDYQLYDQNLSAEDGNTLVQKTEDIAQYIYSILDLLRKSLLQVHPIYQCSD